MAPPKATFWKQATPGTTYYRCTLPARHLPGKVVELTTGDVKPKPDPFTGQIGDDFYFPRQEGAAVWQFPGNRTRGLLMKGMRHKGIRTLVEVDDNYLVVAPPIPNRIMPWQHHNDGTDNHNHDDHRMILGEECDGVIVATPRLWQHYKRFNPNVYICPNQIDPQDWEEPQVVDRPLTIGWSGSDSHLTDAPLVHRALEWASKQPDVQVVMLGADPGWGFDYKHVPWTDTLDQYRRSLQALDVGICPVKSSVWHDCKSDVKCLEYSMAGAMPIPQDTEPYRPWTERGWPCGTDEKGWLAVIKHVVQNRDEIPKLAAEAKDYVLKERTIERNIWRWEEAIEAT